MAISKRILLHMLDAIYEGIEEYAHKKLTHACFAERCENYYIFDDNSTIVVILSIDGKVLAIREGEEQQ